MSTIPATLPPAERLARAMESIPQAPCPMHHYFAGGIYAREMTLSAGVVVVGAAHKTEHLCIISQGKLLVFADNDVKMMRAPFTFVSKPGAQRVGYALETTVWTTYHVVGDERDLDKIMLEICGMTNVELGGGKQNRQYLRSKELEEDRLDYAKFLTEFGLVHEEVDRLSQDLSDQIDFPSPVHVVKAKSPIAGFGLFATRNFGAGECIGMARINGRRTPLGSTVNHSARPNVIGHLTENGDIEVVTLRPILAGEEITSDYRQAMAINGSGLEPIERITS